MISIISSNCHIKDCALFLYMSIYPFRAIRPRKVIPEHKPEHSCDVLLILATQNCSSTVHREVLCFCCHQDPTLLQCDEDILPVMLLDNEWLLMMPLTAEGADYSWMLWGWEPWRPSLKDSNYYDDEREEQNCDCTCGKAEEFLSERQQERSLKERKRITAQQTTQDMNVDAEVGR